MESLEEFLNDIAPGGDWDPLIDYINKNYISKDKIEKLEKEIEELNRDNTELRILRNKLSIVTTIALNGKKISLSKKTINELNNMCKIEMEYRPMFDDYIFYAK